MDKDEEIESLKKRLEEQRTEARRWQQYTYAVIDAVPAALRSHVSSRLDATGHSAIEGGLWNLIMERTKK